MTALRRLGELFVAPADRWRDPPDIGSEDLPAPASRPACALGPPPSVALLATAGDAAATAAALALALARARRARAAIACLWSAEVPPWRAPALPAAARLARVLAARGHHARPTGRVVLVRLAEEPHAAAAEARRALAAAAGAPAVVGLGGPRAAAFDALLESQDLVVVALPEAAEPALARLAVDGLQRALWCAVPPAAPARRLAAAGVALLPSVRRTLAEPLEAVR